MSESAQIAVIEDSAAGKNAALTLVYDADATQHIPVGDGVFAVVKPYSDELYLQEQKELTELVNQSLQRDADQEVSEVEIKEALLRDVKLADELIETLENYPDLPENWRELLSVEDKQAIIRKALNFVVDEDRKRLSLGKTVVPTACWFNGEVANQEHILRNKTIDDSSRYALIQSKQYKTEKSKKFGKEDSYQIVSQVEAKWKLYLDMRESVKGFANDKVPMRVGVMVIDYVFAKSLDVKK